MSRLPLLLLVVALLALLIGLGAFLLVPTDEPLGVADPVGKVASARAERGLTLPEPESGGQIAALDSDRAARPDTPGERLQSAGVAPAGIEGRVIDRAGNPRAGSRLALLRAVDNGFAALMQSTGLTATADASGQFVMDGLPTGAKLAIEASDEQSAPTRVALSPLGVGEQRRIGDLVLGPGTTLTGHVRDEDGQGLPGARVEVADSMAGGALLRSVLCTADGAYAVPHLAPRQYAISASLAGYAPMESVQAFVLGPAGPQWTVDFQLPTADQRIEGRTVDPMGGPLSDVGLTLLRRQPGNGSHFLVSTRSDEAGRFTLEDLPKGPFDVSVDSSDWYLAAALRLDPGKGLQEVRLHPATVIHGRLICSGPVPEHFSITAKPDGRSGARLLGRSPAKRSFEARNGEALFDWTGLHPGAYSFVVDAPGYASTRSQDVILEQGQESAELSIPLTAGGTLTGRVSPAGGNVRVELRGADWDPASPLEDAFPTPTLNGRGAKLDEQGAFRLEHVPAGRFVLSVRADGMPTRHLRDVLVTEGGSHDLGLIELQQGGFVSGRVMGPDGRPRSGATLRLAGDGVHFATITDSRGEFRLESVPAGHYEATASPSNLSEALTLEAREPVDVLAGAEATLELRLTERLRRR